MEQEQNTIKLLFLGDITGRQGRTAVKSYLSSEGNKADFVIANIENASHGFGLTKKNYDDLSQYIDCMTSGNHIWDKKDIYDYISDAIKLLRPLNYPEGTPGSGSAVFETAGHKIGVISLLGRVFMPTIDSPWQIAEKEIEKLKAVNVTDIFIDFHAEATAEKICFARYISDKYNSDGNCLIKGMFGTHTHVQTADEKIINGMAYITDAGFCGAYDSVIGMEYSTSLKRLVTGLPERYETVQSGQAQINGVEVLFDNNGAKHIKRINLLTDNIENEKEADLDSGG